MTRHLRLAALITVAGLLAAACNNAEVETVEMTGPMFVNAEPVTLESIRASVTVTGTVTPSPGADWTITAPESGRIVEMPKAEGEVVKAGDLLVRFEVPSLIAELAARVAETSAATARVQAARSNATRLSGLLDRGIASQRETDEARREQQEAESALGQATSGKQAAEILAARVVITARFAGVVARRWHNLGDLVDASSGDPVLRLIDPARLEIVAAVPVAQLPLVGPGKIARIFNPSDASLIEGTVLTIPPAVDSGAATGDVRITLPKNPAPAAAPTGATAAGAVVFTVGMAVQVEIMSDERKNAMVVPTSAVLHEGMDAYVMVAGTDGKAHRKSVMVGLVAHERTQIISGLTAGEHVILAGPEPIPDGASVTIRK